MRHLAFSVPTLPVMGALALSLVPLHDAKASLTDQYVCKVGDASFTVVVNELEPGPATLYGPLDSARPNERLHMRLEEKQTAEGFRYEAGIYRFSGRFAHAALFIGTEEAACEMEAEPGA